MDNTILGPDSAKPQLWIGPAWWLAAIEVIAAIKAGCTPILAEDQADSGGVSSTRSRAPPSPGMQPALLALK
jgi:hypothetical protein